MNHLFRREPITATARALFCIGLLCCPAAAAQGFAEGARLCTGSLLPALFPFLVVCEMLVAMPMPTVLLRPLACLLGLHSEDTAAALLASWLGGYAVCACLTANLRRSGHINARDAALLMLLGCCSGPGFVVGYIGGLLLGNTALGLLLYGLQLAANLLATGLCLPLLPKAETGKRQEPAERKAVALPQAISAAALTCLNLCACVIFFRVVSAILLQALPLPEEVEPWLHALCEVTAGCAAFAKTGGTTALYGICLTLSLLGLSVWSQLRLLLQGQVPIQLLLLSRGLHALIFPVLVRLLLWVLTGDLSVYSSLSARVVPLCRLPPDAAAVAAVFLCTLLYKGYKNFYNTI